MPELPEVESLRRILARSAAGRRMMSATVREGRLRRAVSRDLPAAVTGRTVQSVGRRAKYLLIELSGGQVIMVHLGMSGSLTHRRDGFDPGALDPRHDHVEFALDDGSRLVYNDPRRFGLMKVVARSHLDSTEELKGLGPEPLGSDFNAAYLWQITRGRAAAIKNVLMDQRVVAGVGNIYASEILFRAQVRPTRPAGKVTRAEVARIVEHTVQVLREAIGRRGTTFRSYRDSRGQPGRFAERLRVYDRAGKPCPACTTAIRSVIVGQRSSFYCPRCQK
ncbi:MAG TPA: bifunctional DNA-formamidopyrimidine glycosylase/DNA-(apurinic or apyrimidinic site) lyase [Candidatus Binataceae bacterium]|nr:bifunctional DNA-formamidopyrimidine glycosylase/DNA-(apurinic or apyrimidinic site) lyase [Candidatus Binataceae bacterium]